MKYLGDIDEAQDVVDKAYVDISNGDYLYPEMFGAIGDDSNDDAPAFRLMFAEVKATEKPVRLTAGKTYALKSADPNDPSEALGVYLQDMKNVTVIGWGAIIKGYDGILENPANPGAMIWLEASSNDYVNTWVGVHLDMSQITPAGGGVQTVGGLSFRGQWTHNIDSCNFDHGLVGANTEGIIVGGGDQSLFLSGFHNAVVSNNKFRGAPDLGIYISGGSARNLKIIGNHFLRCARGVGIKRTAGFWLLEGNTFEECDIGVYTPTADGLSDNGGKYGIVSGNFFKKIQSRPIDVDGLAQGTIICNNRIEDFHRKISDGTANDLGEPVAAIRTRGSLCQVYGNVIIFVDWTSTSTSGRESVGVMNQKNSTYTLSGEYNAIHDNTFRNVTIGISILSSSVGVREYNNQYLGVTTNIVNAGTITRGLSSQGTYIATSGSAANLFMTSAGDVFRSTSAKKYKKNIKTLTDEDLEKFMRLRGVSYKSKSEADDPDARFIGVIADEADELGLKELVTYGKDGEIEGFQYDRTIAILLEIVKKQDKRISDLEKTSD